MITRWARVFIVLFAVLLLAVGGVASAARMAASQDDIARLQIAALGQTPDAICGHLTEDRHDCPFCHIDPQPPAPAPMQLLRQFIPWDGWRQQRDLHRHAQARDHARAPRAPPPLS